MTADPSVVEIWSLYAISTVIIAMRVFARTKMVGVPGYRPDDYIIFLAWALHTTVSTMATLFALVAKGKHTSLLTHEERLAVPASEIPIWQYGSKNFVAGMSCYTAVVWTLKINMLFFYRRLVAGQWVEKYVYPVMGLVVTTAVAITLIIFLTCRPISLMWQVRPDPGPNCVPQNRIFFYSILSMNVTTDLLIMAIPIPVISLVRASIWRRLGVYFLFSLGLFVISASIIRVILVFHPTGQFGPAAMWSIREDFVAILVGQAPMIVPMFKKRFWQQSRIKYTPKSSRGSEGHELSNGMSNQQKKPRDPYSLTQMGFTHVTNITNVTRGTLTEATKIDKGSDERLSIRIQAVPVTDNDRMSDRDLKYRSGNLGSQSLDITPAPDIRESEE